MTKNYPKPTNDRDKAKNDLKTGDIVYYQMLFPKKLMKLLELE